MGSHPKMLLGPVRNTTWSPSALTTTPPMDALVMVLPS